TVSRLAASKVPGSSSLRKSLRVLDPAPVELQPPVYSIND
uniref:Movement protein n=1 Tax=Strongyloides stercoralis TaxID=6248 RepID=A0A0K0ETR9_STRER